MAKEKLQYDSNGWAELSSGVRLHASGQGQVIFRSSGLVLSSGIRLGLGNGGDPSSEDLPYAEFKFRMLSKTLIEGYWIDFTKDNILKDAIKLFETKIFKDHVTNVENSIGVVLNPTWNSEKGNEGIDATYRIFREFGSSIIGRLETEPPILDSTSVGIRFTYEKSHPDLDYFYSNLGREIDGQIVRFIITKILAVPETSIVCAGADPKAKRFSIQSNHFEESSSMPGEENPKEENMKIKLKVFESLGVALEPFGLEKQGDEIDLTSANLEAVFKEAGSKISQLETSLGYYAGLSDLDKFAAGFDHKTNVAKLKKLLEEPKKFLEAIRNEALRLYGVFAKGKENSAIVSMIENADLEQAKAFAEQYGAKLEEIFPEREDESGGKTRASGKGLNIKEKPEKKFKIKVG
ncbi:hypothetical protein [Leptospira borgpetersenii]|uniref:hypothetical protein n=1 Tax=Leptospira borgpetersenii TaxID=174 RepID=UPI00187F7B71|nr:hypothetical protein [Leptospira borgpetersenii]MBE8363451.1 hypothetical protein [Leptospira borgpetersenii serovar Balcanica]MBE8367107.1 hypothetical protein [Leptospira borgpetersenii serovar Balcanica]MBE8422518.1 hypothetical protein [Leptospira borgpetersenii serovar Balcanica]MBF3349627.1 hypothetical protein [Leptospira borgpetersenii serovar Balcanica]